MRRATTSRAVHTNHLAKPHGFDANQQIKYCYVRINNLPGSLLDGSAVLNAARRLQVVEEPVNVAVTSQERGGIVVPRGTQNAVRVVHPGELRRV